MSTQPATSRGQRPHRRQHASTRYCNGWAGRPHRICLELRRCHSCSHGCCGVNRTERGPRNAHASKQQCHGLWIQHGACRAVLHLLHWTRVPVVRCSCCWRQDLRLEQLLRLLQREGLQQGWRVCWRQLLLMVIRWLLEVLLWGVSLHRCMLPTTTTLPAAASKRCTALHRAAGHACTRGYQMPETCETPLRIIAVTQQFVQASK